MQHDNVDLTNTTMISPTADVDYNLNDEVNDVIDYLTAAVQNPVVPDCPVPTDLGDISVRDLYEHGTVGTTPIASQIFSLSYYNTLDQAIIPLSDLCDSQMIDTRITEIRYFIFCPKKMR